MLKQNTMDQLYFNDYDRGVRFISNTKQITFHTDLFRKANKKALDDFRKANKKAIDDFHKANKKAIDTHADRTEKIISAHTTAVREEELMNRRNFETQFNNLIAAVNVIFNEDATDEKTSFYEMVKEESQKAQREIGGVGTAISTQGNSVKNAITAQTSTIGNAITAQTKDVREKLADVISELNDIEGKIDAQTSGNRTNTSTISGKLGEIKTAIDNIDRIVLP